MAGELAGKSHLGGCRMYTACDFLGEVEGPGFTEDLESKSNALLNV